MTRGQRGNVNVPSVERRGASELERRERDGPYEIVWEPDTVLYSYSGDASE